MLQLLFISNGDAAEQVSLTVSLSAVVESDTNLTSIHTRDNDKAVHFYNNPVFWGECVVVVFCVCNFCANAASLLSYY